MASIFDLQDNLSAPSQSFYDKFLQDRQQLQQQRPDIALQMPAIGASTPGQVAYQETQTQPAATVADGVKALSGMLSQGDVQPGAKPNAVAKAQQDSLDTINALLDQRNPMKPKETIGPDLGSKLGMPANSGGILGLGIQPIDVLAFAIGAGLTSRMPQDQAMAWTMKIAGLPKAFEDHQNKSATDFINQVQQSVGLQNATTHMGLLQDQAAIAKAKQDAIDVAGLLADNGKKIPPSIAIRAGVSPTVALGMQTGHWSIQNTADGLYAVNTADPTQVQKLGMTRGATAATPYADIQQTAIGRGLKAGTPEYQDFVNQQVAAQAGLKAGSTANAQIPAKIEVGNAIANTRAENQRENIDYRLQALGNAPVTEKTSALWVDGSGKILPTSELIGRKPSDVLAKYPDAVKLASTQERNQLASATSLPDLRAKIAPLLPQILAKYGGNNLTDILSVQGNRLVVKLKGAAGDPQVARLNALLTDFLVETPLAMGMVAGREGPELLKRYEAGMPGMGSTVQSALAAMDANIESVATRWAARGIDITRGRMGGGGGASPAAPSGNLSPDGMQFLQELKKAMGQK